MGQLKRHSPFMLISLAIKVEYIVIFQDLHWEDMQLRLLGGVLKVELLIGRLLTHGIKIGEMEDSLELEEEITNVELKVRLLLVFQNLGLL